MHVAPLALAVEQSAVKWLVGSSSVWTPGQADMVKAIGAVYAVFISEVCAPEKGGPRPWIRTPPGQIHHDESDERRLCLQGEV